MSGEISTKIIRSRMNHRGIYNPDFRQLVHVSYKIAAELAPEFYAALERNADVVAEQVKENILDRHIARLF